MPKHKLLLDNDRAQIWRDENGVPHIEAKDEAAIYWGLGYCHAMDRGMQMLLMRILGRGQASEFLEASDDMLKIDTFFRKMNWHGGISKELEKLFPQAQALCSAYCEGANAYLSRKSPWEFKLVGYRPEPWQPEDIILLSRLVGYLTLAQSQAEIERILVEMVQAGISPEMLEELFPGQLNELDEDLLRKVKLTERIVPESVRWNPALAPMMASNNWVISGKKTASGKPILANDPHLETNRLPNVWYEVVATCQDRYALSATMPGLPAFLIGRTNDLAWGATYTFMDSVDSWVEHCREGKYRRAENQWVAFQQRKETIKRKNKAAVEVVFYENEHGVLEGDPHDEGFYLATRWSSGDSGSKALNHAVRMWHAGSVEEGMQLLGNLETAWNWVLADRHGNIGYQMSGLMPKRRFGVSGLVPLPGWEPENDWQGFVDPKDLPRCMNPASGYFITANNDLNHFGVAKPISVSMGPYRAERITALLSAEKKFSVEDNFAIHYDVYSKQAEAFMAIFEPLLPETPQGKIVREWDCRYDPDSKGAFLFEECYRALLLEVFGKRGVGEKVAEFLCAETGIVADFYHAFDRVLLSERSSWFGEESRDDLFRRVLAKALQTEPRTWGEAQKIEMKNIMLGEKMPAAFGFNRGPISIRGGRATPHQGQIYKSAGRVTSFTPSFRFVTDLSTDEMRTNMAGGPSDRRFSKWYCSDLDNWIKGIYKVLRPEKPVAHGSGTGHGSRRSIANC